MKVLKNNKIRYILFSSLAAIVVFAGVSLASLSAKTSELTNKFKVGEVTTEIEEDDPTINKTVINKAPKVVNLGPNDCIVRMRVTISPEEIKAYLDDLKKKDPDMGINFNTEWKYNDDDGYWYYQKIVPYVENDTDASSTTPLFDKITGLTDAEGKIIDKFENLDDFSITLYQESVQAIVYDDKGEVIASAYKDGEYNHTNALNIWKNYDQNK